MAKVEIYTTNLCGYCFAAKRMLNSKNVDFEEISLSSNPERRGEMMERAKGRRTVPQIFIDGKHIGGFDDMAALNSEGRLDPLLLA